MHKIIPQWGRYIPLLSDVVVKKQFTNTHSNKRSIFKCISESSDSELSYNQGLQLSIDCPDYHPEQAALKYFIGVKLYIAK